MKLTHLISRICLFAGGFICATAMADTACNKQPVKAERTQAVGRDMIVNGVPTSIWRLEFGGTPDDVSNEFRDFWTHEDVPAKGQRQPAGWMLTALDDTCQYVLNVQTPRPGARTSGLLSVMNLSGNARHQIPDSATPLPDGGTVISDVESRDPGQAGRTWLIELPGRARDNAQRYSDQLSDHGWSMVAKAPAYVADGSQQAGDAVVMQRGGERLDAVFSDRNGKTQAVVNAARNR